MTHCLKSTKYLYINDSKGIWQIFFNGHNNVKQRRQNTKKANCRCLIDYLLISEKVAIKFHDKDWMPNKILKWKAYMQS